MLKTTYELRYSIIVILFQNSTYSMKLIPLWNWLVEFHCLMDGFNVKVFLDTLARLQLDLNFLETSYFIDLDF